MKTLSISEARNTLSTVVDSVASTRASVVLLKHGKPAAMLVPIAKSEAQADPYPLRGTPITLADDFDAPLPDMWSACAVAEESESYCAVPEQPAQANRKRGQA